MRTDIRKLRGALALSGETQESMAKQLKLTAGTVSRKMKAGGMDFTVGQVHAIADWLNLSDAEITDIFFCRTTRTECEK